MALLSDASWIPPRYCAATPLARGGFAEAWRATDRTTDEAVVLKRFTAPIARHDVRRERAVLRHLDLPSIPRLIAEGDGPAGPYLVLEYVDGAPFSAPAVGVRLPSVIRRLLSTLQQVHGLEVVHGDLKPANVLVDAAGTPHLLDFGCSTGAFLRGGFHGGTLSYMAPELLRGDAPTVATDLYALGVMIFECLTDRVPHHTDDPDAFVPRRAVGAAPAIPDGPLQPLLQVMLAAHPGDRPGSALEALSLLDAPPLVPVRCPGPQDIRGLERVFHVPSRAVAALQRAGADWAQTYVHWAELGLIARDPDDRTGFVADVRLVRHLEATVRGDATGGRFEQLLEAIQALVEEGRAEAAAELVRWGLTADRPAHEIERLLREAVLAGFERGTEFGLQAALLELERSRCEAPQLEQLVQVGLLAYRDPERGGSAALPTFTDPDLAFWAVAVRVLAARRRHPREERAVVEAIAARQDLGHRLRASVVSWSAWLGYREGDFGRAADELARAAEGRVRFADRVSDLLHAASCAIEAARFPEAERWIAAAWAHCRERVAPHFEARCEWLGRVLAWRTGRADAPDEALVAAVERLRQPGLTGQVALTEAAIARKLGATAVAADLATLAGRRFAAAESPVHDALATALARSLGAAVGRSAVENLEIAMRCGVPRVGAQIAWLEGCAAGAPAGWRDCYIALRSQVATDRIGLRAEVLEGLPEVEGGADGRTEPGRTTGGVA